MGLCVCERVYAYGYMCVGRCLSAGRLWLTQVGVPRAEPIDLSAVNKPYTHTVTHKHSLMCMHSEQ